MVMGKIAPIAASVAFASVLMAGTAGAPLALAADALKADSIGGVVTSAKGPEAGVWVVAETKDLGTPFIKIVVTDDQGRYLLPQLPKANYKVWVRGYGLVDSKPVQSAGGSHLDLTAVVAPDAKSAAQYYPANYWLSLLKIPDPSQFPGTGPQGNGIAPVIKTQQQWVSNLKQCTQCHQLGDLSTREIADNTPAGWSARVQQARALGDPIMGDQAGGYARFMNNAYTQFGRDGASNMFAAWTQDVAKGALPKEMPPRPQGAERNVVLTLWAWGKAGSYFHDEVSTDRRNPHINANGPIYGTQILVGKFGILDPVKNTYSEVDIPKGYDGYVHTVMMDSKGRVWMPDGGMGFQPPEKTRVKRDDFCTNTQTSKYAAYSPVSANAAYIDIYDPKTKQMTNIPSCAGGGHVWFGYDKDETLFITGGGMSWISAKIWDETHDPAKAQGWCPLVINTKEKGITKVAAKSDDITIDPDRKNWNMPGEMVDPHKDTQIQGGTYGLGVNPVDGSVWAGLPRYPGGIVRLDRGSNPPETCKTEYYEPPKDASGAYLGFAPHDLNIDSKGIAWVSFTSGQIGRFDRSKCKVMIGPSATGQHCQEGWKVWDGPGPHLSGVKGKPESTDMYYQTFVDRFNTFGLGKDIPMFPGVNSDAIYAFLPDTEKWVTVRVPYPMGFYTRWIDGRIDDEKAGWKGRGAWATYSTVAPWHQEDEAPQLVHFQIRPNPLAD